MQVRFHAHDKSPSDRHLTVGRVYSVYAISVYDKTLFVQIVDDLDTPIFLPSGLFQMVESTIPTDWICNLFPESPVEFVMGSAFMAESLAAYDAMVDHRLVPVTRFWERIRARDPRSKSDEEDE